MLVLNWQRYALIYYFLSACFTVQSQDFIVHSQHYSVEQGLPHREVNAIHQCSRGFIWLGTPGHKPLRRIRFSNLQLADRRLPTR